MADGAAYNIDINARAIGVDSSAAQVNQLAAQLDAASSTSTKFDSALERTAALLTAASAASKSAADAVGQGQSKYNDLEMAATKAAKAVEKATLSGKGNNMHVLLMEADAASQALANEATVLDALKASAKAATDEEKKLAASMKTLEKSAVAAGNRDPFGGFLKGSKAVLGGPIFEKIDQLRGAFKSGEGGAAMAGVAIGAVVTGVGLAVKAAEMLATAFIAVGVAAVTGLITLATFAVKTNEKAMKSLTATNKLAEKNFAKLFSGVNVDKFTAAYADVASMLDETTSSGQALKELIGTILNPLFDSAPSAGAAIKELFKQAIILALQTATAFYLVKNALEGGKPLDPQVEFALKAAAVTAGILVLSLVIVAATIAALAAAAMAIPAAFVAMSVAAQMIGQRLGELGKEAASAAGNIISGLVNGIASGTGMVVAAMAGLGSSAIGALKSALGIASPSKYAIAMMTNVTDTSADTLEKGTPGVQSAMESMVEPPDMPSAQAIKSGKQESGSSSSKSLVLSGTYNFYGIKDAADAESKFSAMLTRLIEGDALQMGGEVPA